MHCSLVAVYRLAFVDEKFLLGALVELFFFVKGLIAIVPIIIYISTINMRSVCLM